MRYKRFRWSKLPLVPGWPAHYRRCPDCGGKYGHDHRDRLARHGCNTTQRRKTSCNRTAT